METPVQMKIMEKLRIIFKTINLMLESSLFSPKNIGELYPQKIKEIVFEQKLFETMNMEDMERISKLEKKYIYKDEFENNENFYAILYDIFLNKMHKYYNHKADSIVLFKTFNEAYFYKKYISYLSEFIEKYPETLSDDIIKEKLFEIIHCLGADDELYYQDFYFYISMYHIHYHYQKNDISIPEYKKFNDTIFENSNTEAILTKIKDEKKSILNFLIKYVNNRKGKNHLLDMLFETKKEIKNNIFFENDDFEKVCWNEIAKSKEKNLINYLQNNKTDKDVVALDKLFEVEDDLNDKFKFYFTNNMKSFLSLPQEDKYVIVNSFDDKLSFYKLNLEYNTLKISYDEGMKKENNIKNIVQEIIEDKEFYNSIRAIFTSEKVVDYCKNPIQYIKGNKVKIYDEKEEEKKKIKKFTVPKLNEDEKAPDFESNGFPDLTKPEPLLEEELINLKNKEEKDDYKCQLQRDYEYFLDNVFDENFLKERIVYSYLPNCIKAFVCCVPKIMINICGNSIISYKDDINSEDYKTILKALYTVIIIHEFIHLIRRENRNESLTNEFTPKPDKNSYNEGGQSFIYHVFGDFKIYYLDIQFAKAILNLDSWKKDNLILKKELLRFDITKNDIINALKKNGGIKCYDSFVEDDDNLSKKHDYCC